MLALCQQSPNSTAEISFSLTFLQGWVSSLAEDTGHKYVQVVIANRIFT